MVEEMVEEKERIPIDVEDLIEKKPYLLLEGDPGSGKTTMVKHLARDVLRGERINGFLPVLIYLNDLKEFLDDMDGIAGDIGLARSLMKLYFKKKENGLTVELVEGFCKAGRAILLLDGLDEVDEKYRSSVSGAFHRVQIKYERSRVVITSRPHAVQSAMRWFGDKHRKINSLTWDQKEQFVHRWFEHLAGKSDRIKVENAGKLLGEMKEMGDILDFISTPLILTAVCILYMDERKLPEQRADLYNRIINNLVEKRFKGYKIENMPELMHRFLGKLAFEMMKKGEKKIDKVEAEKLLGEFFKRKEGEEENEYTLRIRNLFEKVEPDCGLLTREKGSFSFYHLTYQEFLAGRYMISIGTDYWKEIKPYIDKDWWGECIVLYIGFLSIDNQGWANKIIGKLLASEKRDHWFLAVSGLCDIIEDQRDGELLGNAQEKMLWMMTGDDPILFRFIAGEALGKIGDTRDLKKFVKITAGKYVYQEEKVELGSFEISKYPVTNLWFREFVDIKGYENEGLWTKEGWKWKKKEEIIEPENWHERKWNISNFPVVGVSWYEAKAFCNWLNSLDDDYIYDLPMEKQWEAAARGIKGRKYPWGEKLKKEDDRCNYMSILDRTSPVGMFSKGNTLETAISDMAGNVWEWCDDIYDEEWGSNRVIRGGSWIRHAEYCSSTYRSRRHPEYRYYFVGFRLVRSARPRQADAKHRGE